MAKKPKDIEESAPAEEPKETREPGFYLTNPLPIRLTFMCAGREVHLEPQSTQHFTDKAVAVKGYNDLMGRGVTLEGLKDTA